MSINPENQDDMDWDDADIADIYFEEEPAQFPTDRPGLVTFAAVMLFILAGFQGTWAITELFNTAWIAGTTYGTFNGLLWIWATLDILLAGFTLFAGFDLLAGGAFAHVYGLLVAGISAVRWFFYLPAAPWLGIVVIALDILIIYALVANTDYFRAENASGA